MFEFPRAISLIKRYEGFNEIAFPDPDTGSFPYTIGYGTQYYPDGEPVKQGQLCTKGKALEYLFSEIKEIANDIDGLNLGLDDSMKEALISFVHSVGWEPFIYSSIIDYCDQEDWSNAAHEMTRWIFGTSNQVIGNLIDRRREETQLFLSEVDDNPWLSGEVLVRAFRNYDASPSQVRAIRQLEENINPYVLAEFSNSFDINNEDPFGIAEDEVRLMYNAWV